MRQIVDLDILTAVAFLSSREILESYTYGDYLNISTTKTMLLLEQIKIRRDIPEHIHQNELEVFFNNIQNLHELIAKSIHQIQNKYMEKTDIKQHLLINWINLTTILPPLVFSYDLQTQNHYSSLISSNTIRNILGDNLKLIDTHMHINGASEAIYHWNYYMNNLSDMYKIFKNACKKSSKFFIQNKKDIHILIHTLRVCKIIKNNILNNKYMALTSEQWLNLLNIRKYQNVQKSYFFNYFKQNTIIEQEKEFYNKIHKLITISNRNDDKNLYAKLLHFYILSQAFFNKYFIYQLYQYGFDQFQMITDSKFRDPYEDMGFEDRFRQIQDYNYDSIEIRFAPKTKFGNNLKLLNKIGIGYFLANTNTKNLQPLSITAHFIRCDKNQCKVKTKANRSCIAISNLIGKELKHKSKFYGKITSIDVAGNELYARPDIFCNIFKILRKKHSELKFTFHAGEEFLHIISGIRYIYEAIRFLNFQSGDRIGHATALGIPPLIWKEKLNNSIKIKRQEHLDNLFFIYKILSDIEISHFSFDMINEIKNLHKWIYGFDFSQKDYDEFYNNRHINPNKIKNSLYKHHFIRSIQNRADELIEVDINAISNDLLIYLQNRVLSMLKEKGVAIECMITSNTRISYYENFKDHHILKWITNPNAPDIILASDDPGIFGTNLYIEYSILYSIISDTDFYKPSIIKQLMSNSEKYYFSP